MHQDKLSDHIGILAGQAQQKQAADIRGAQSDGDRAMCDLHCSLSNLDGMVLRLKDRLHLAIRPLNTAQGTDAKGQAPQPIRAPIVESIVQAEARVQGLIRSVEELIELIGI